jgi:hypothetical protein
MVEIKKITIKGGSGWCPPDEAYEDTVIITEKGISYSLKYSEEKPWQPSRSIKWSYRADSMSFRDLFMQLQNAVLPIMDLEEFSWCDAGMNKFTFLFSDGTKQENTFFGSSELFDRCFRVAKKMIPPCEEVPNVLKTEEDYEEDDEDDEEFDD